MIEPDPPSGTVARLGGATVLLLAIAAAVWLAVHPEEPTGRVALVIGAGVAGALTVSSVGSALGTCLRWAALFVIGQAAALQLMNAGRLLHYQHLRPLTELLDTERLAVGILTGQLVAVGWYLGHQRVAVATWVRDTLGPWRALALFGVLTICSATVNADRLAWAWELGLASLLQLMAAGTLVAAARSIPAGAATRLRQRLAGVLGSDGGRPDHGGIDRFAWWCAAFVVVVTAALCLGVYQRHPHVQDEVKYLLQARYFAHGVLSLPVPPVPKAFEMYLFEVGPRGWYSVVPPGWAAVLASGVPLGAAWLVNPLLTGLNILLVYVLLRSLYPLRVTRTATLLLSLSPMHLFLGMSFMAHAVTLTCALLGALAVQRVRRTGEVWPMLLGGIAVGFSAAVRQLDGLIAAVALGLWCLGWGGSRVRFRSTAALVVGTVLGVAPLLPYNSYFTGHGTTFPIMSYHDRLFHPNANAYGFGSDRGMGWPLDPNPGHSPLDALINANLNTTTMNVELFGWGFGSLLLVAYLVIRGRLSREDRAMLFVVGLTVAAYAPNYFSGGPDFGARYWFPMLVPLTVLTARGLYDLQHRGGPFGDVRVSVVGAALFLGALATFVPWRSADKYYHYLGMRPDVKTMANDPTIAGALVLVRGKELPDYLSAAIYNPLDLRGPQTIFAHDVDASTRRALFAAYPERRLIVMDGPTLTHRGYQVVARGAVRDSLASTPAP